MSTVEHERRNVLQVRRHWYRHPIWEEHGCGRTVDEHDPSTLGSWYLILAFFLGRSQDYISFMIMVDGLPSVDLGTGAHIVGNIFLEKPQDMGAKHMGDNDKILDRQMRA